MTEDEEITMDALRRERDEMEARSDLFARIVRDVAEALGQDAETTHDLGAKVKALRMERDALLEACEELAGSSAEFDDDRIGYITVQIGRETLAFARTVIDRAKNGTGDRIERKQDDSFIEERGER